MKLHAAIAAGVIASVAIVSGCASTGMHLPALTFQQQAAVTCGLAKGEMAILQSDGVLVGAAADTASQKVMPAIAGVCAAAANVTDVQTLVNAALPELKIIVAGSSLPTDKKSAANAAIDTVILAANTAIALQSAQASAVSTPASAPVAASIAQ